MGGAEGFSVNVFTYSSLGIGYDTVTLNIFKHAVLTQAGETVEQVKTLANRADKEGLIRKLTEQKERVDSQRWWSLTSTQALWHMYTRRVQAHVKQINRCLKREMKNTPCINLWKTARQFDFSKCPKLSKICVYLQSFQELFYVTILCSLYKVYSNVHQKWPSILLKPCQFIM